MTIHQMPQTPELDRQNEIIKSGKAGTIQDFIDWLRDEKHYVIGEWIQERATVSGDVDELVPIRTSPLELMADFFGIDLNKIDQERRAILEEIQRRNET